MKNLKFNPRAKSSHFFCFYNKAAHFVTIILNFRWFQKGEEIMFSYCSPFGSIIRYLDYIIKSRGPPHKVSFSIIFKALSPLLSPLSLPCYSFSFPSSLIYMHIIYIYIYMARIRVSFILESPSMFLKMRSHWDLQNNLEMNFVFVFCFLSTSKVHLTGSSGCGLFVKWWFRSFLVSAGRPWGLTILTGSEVHRVILWCI